MIQLRQLRYFLAVAEELHFGRAASRLHVSQPPLSRAIQQLEDAIGARLFERSTQHVALTDAGRTLELEARRLLEQVEHAVSRTRQAARGEVGRLQIGFVSTVQYSVLPALLKDFADARPGVELVLAELTADAQLLALRERRIDVGILLAPVPDGYASRRIHREKLIVALPRAHRLARRAASRPLPLAALRDEPFVLFPRPLAPGLFDTVVAFTRRAGFSPRVAQEAVQMQTIVSLVSAGLGVAIVPACMRNLRRAGVSYRSLSPASPAIETSLVWARDERSMAVTSFVDFVRTRV